MIQPEEFLREMTSEQYENLTGQKKPPSEPKTPAPLSVPPVPPSSEPTLDDELGQYGG